MAVYTGKNATVTIGEAGIGTMSKHAMVPNEYAKGFQAGTLAAEGIFDTAGTNAALKIDEANLAKAGQMDRLMGLLGLNDDERAFVRAGLQPEQGKDFFLVLADYLTDRGRDEAAARFRQMGESV